MATRKSTGTRAPAKSNPISAQRRQGNKIPGGSRSQSGTGKKSSSWPILFWLGFIILLLGIFLINREAITNSVKAIQNEIAGRNAPDAGEPAFEPSTGTELRVPPPSSPPAIAPREDPVQPAVQPQAPGAQPSAAPQTAAPQTAAPQTAAPQTAAPTAATPSPAAPPPTTPVSSTPPATQVSPQAAPQATGQPQAAQGEMRERPLYFILVDRGGSIIRERVIRKVPVSDSPMIDAIGALISGPNGDEKGKGLISLIPPATRILSATVRGDTAYISFSEDFQYNTYGVEGYAAQLRQVIFTATEFPNVKNVQILIEGRRIDYLGEGIWIGSPLNRDML